ncbi:LysR family transcriptional regulator [Pseudomonas sp. ZM23]|uniref:LysR family transcriptional regulator n=1 Tax=Pseudomonas triclosanedens TaxID=2961893 RepID=A0ABY7A4U9_9PSED|nr:LysR family transcriptional regulator [Pseudomonas triclosanedens]MCP8467757.1 LysR family transcriptional regulator [Pseudomonas triclosanedens]MCP8473724.1 LysR family transcriptional regulator [Pseudomonas triclosanedens]MCP8479646.1 LysR family transcriptional regulator [Pseudomonas triclosanedens]WAI51330.1 LysR family transcriptional regulator [Pseudomonas triclosanedens]
MHSIHDLRRIDLNLLVILDALLDERHVTRAAERLAMTQPAVSHALNRLRDLLGDPLLVRSGNQMQLTRRAFELTGPLRDLLGGVRRLVLGDAFDPASAELNLRLGMSDYGAWVALPGLLRVLRQEAPGIRLEVCQASRLDMATQVASGELDGALGVFPLLPEGLRAQRLFEERFTCLCAAETLGERTRLTLDEYLAAPHLRVALQQSPAEEIDSHLERLGQQRKVIVTVPHFSVAPALLAGTDLLLTIAERMLPEDLASQGLARFEPPLQLARIEFVQIWSETSQDDPARRWLRGKLAGLTCGNQPAGA